MNPSRKRGPAVDTDDKVDSDVAQSQSSTTPRSLSHPISPPLKKRRLPAPPEAQDAQTEIPKASDPQKFRSPFQLTRIRDLPSELNRDTVTLTDILGDPLIKECWEFNYLHDIDFLMAAFDEDVRSLVKVHVVHGFWKRDDERKVDLETQASQYPNVSLHAAYLPEMFGTHHSKMMILLRHDDTAQIIIHTANLITQDWTNMTQAVWSSPMLPLLTSSEKAPEEMPPAGTGGKFKIDFLNYLRAYEKQRRGTCGSIIQELTKYDFSAIRGSLIASVPGRFPVDAPTKFGWAAMEEALKAVPVGPEGEIVVQISSIATLGPTDNWLKAFFRTLSGGQNRSSPPSFKVVFPTADEIRKSLDGYISGFSIHTKIQSAQQKKQLLYLKPYFCHWANDSASSAELGNDTVRDAGRNRAAPHIKTYMRYGDKTIDWALVTSANLSKQAWGDARNGAGEVRISSYEIGVLVWPELFAQDAIMSPTFQVDSLPPASEPPNDTKPTVALRMPYSLPLQPYGKDEIPWVATASHTEPDWKGQVIRQK
ncbi:hypothetical protein OQA88_13042 [Cercophora sp. LCS_1]